MAHRLSRKYCRPRSGQKFRVNSEVHALGVAIGDGAAGLVYKVTREHDRVRLAVKFLAPNPEHIDESSFDDVEGRFKCEGERGALLDHPHLLKVHAFEPNLNGAAFGASGVGPVNPFILMEFLPGRTLERHIRKSSVGGTGIFRVTRSRLSIAVQIAKSLEYLHAQKLVHRDIKPANIFLIDDLGDDDGMRVGEEDDSFVRAKLGDFGIMKWGDFHAAVATGVLTATNQVGLGTMKYMSPEQAVRPRDVTVQSDVFSLGITLLELFTSQILTSPHHVFQVMMARQVRGKTTIGRFADMGYEVSPGDADLASLILDMHLQGISGRPSIKKIVGMLTYEYERRFDEAWTL